MRLNLRLVSLCALALFTITNKAHANFHLWKLNEIYSNADGSVQFIELFCSFSGQSVLQNHTLSVTNAGAVHTFTFPSNTPANTFQKSLLLATPGFGSLPGGVTPDYVIPTNFLFSGIATINFGPGADVVSYTNLPNDGVSAMVRSGNSFVINATNSPRNFNGQSGSLTDRKLAASILTSTALRLSFNTRSGRTYVLEATDSLNPTNWQSISTNTGTGTTLSVTNSAVVPPERFYRLRMQ